ncbi:Rpf1 (nucleomorph) [Hemiselmis andersenii]|uniref:Rpf1 n=1 Tax=Hemiselmis andersenii TaxID=464988 RepID=A9BK40_HEMAN|nr:Rpf1 [Hemiselmis andersenii]ABW97873.1 Rpf1 [Hemiselmis andersenii]
MKVPAKLKLKKINIKKKKTGIGIVISKKPTKRILLMVKDLLYLIPHSKLFKKKNFKLQDIISYLKLHNFKNILFVKNEKKGSVFLWQLQLNLKISILYKIVYFLPKKNILNNSSRSFHNPEIIFKNFKGNIGKSLCFLLKSLFSNYPDFKGRQVFSFFFFQKFIIFRFHRYIFSSTSKDVKLQEIGPRFTFLFYKMFKNIPKSFLGNF